MYIINNLKEQLINHFKNDDLIVEFEQPQNIEFGHLSTNFAMKNSKTLKQSPQITAQDVKILFEENEQVEEVKIAGPGFINLYFKSYVFTDIFNELLNDDLIKNKVIDEKKYNMEYVSANPTGDLHLGHARNAIYSDSLSRIMKAAGYNVTREYYVNDAGAQMINLGLSVKYFYLKEQKIEIEFPEDGYRGEEIENIGKLIFSEFSDSKNDADISWFTNFAYEINMNEIKDILKQINVGFDVFSSEKYYHDSNKVSQSIDVLRNIGDIYEKEDAIWLNSSKYGDDKDRVIQKSDKTHTYLTSDIAYHNDKFERGFDHLIDVWGGDHHGYVDRISASIQALGRDKSTLEVILIQMVSIFRNNEVVKMSKRKGTSVTIKELINLVDVDAIRYFFVMRSPDTQLDFDIELATKNNNENPVFYIQYANARINSILKRAKEENIKISDSFNSVNKSDEEICLKLLKFNDIILEAAEKRLPHILANYLYDVSSLYHAYYNQFKVFGDNLNETSDRLNLNIVVSKVIEEGLELLGIEPRKEM